MFALWLEVMRESERWMSTGCTEILHRPFLDNTKIPSALSCREILRKPSASSFRRLQPLVGTAVGSIACLTVKAATLRVSICVDANICNSRWLVLEQIQQRSRVNSFFRCIALGMYVISTQAEMHLNSWARLHFCMNG